MTKLLASYILLVIVMIALSVLLILPREMEQLEATLDQSLSRVTYILAYDKEIIRGLEEGEFSPELRSRLDGILERGSSTIDYLVVANRDSIRLYHPNPERIGGKFTGGDEVDALAGKATISPPGWGIPTCRKGPFTPYETRRAR